jgi:UDP-N-acetylmuramoyl-tripeptide--D-alanyl-D-alanine ligase
MGQHNVTNLLLATAAAVHEGMTLADVAWRVRQIKPAESRLARQTTLRASPSSTMPTAPTPPERISALQSLSLHTSGKRLLITPGMIELGPMQQSENQRLGQIAAQHATDVILVGAEQTRPIKAGLDAAGFPAERLRVVEELRGGGGVVRNNLGAGDTVLFLNDLPDTYLS